VPDRRAEPHLNEASSPTPRPVGRRVADVPVDHVSPVAEATPAAAYVGRRRAATAPVATGAAAYTQVSEVHPHERGAVLTEERPAPAAPRSRADALDTGEIRAVLADLEPRDQSTSFEHEPTAQLPMLRPEPEPTTYGSGGKRRAAKRATGRGPLFRRLPSAPVLMGVTALALSVGGAITVGGPQPASSDATATEVTHAATALGGDSGQGRVSVRKDTVTRDSARDAQSDAAGKELKAAAEGLAQERNSELKVLAGDAEKYAKELAKDVWVYPLEPVVLTARFGQYGLWSSYHTGLDFNGETGDQIHAIANGEVISAGYDGSYGNKTVVRLEDGTEIWYCHQSAFGVSVGDTVTRGEVIGLVGATGNVTGSHLHVEVRPGGGDPVDPYTAMQQHGLF
jgi:murein DD-endopeptidase MepM/ murein hydrolase activator NlpD